MSNKELIIKFYDEVFNAWDTSKLEQYMLPGYMQHNPTVADGIDGFRAFCEKFFTMKPHMDIVKIVCEDDMVVVFFKCTLENGAVNKVFDMYRIENGKLAEHWDCVMHSLDDSDTASGRSNF